ncbi:MAG: transcription antitermination factor NusB, partial [Acholeplasma sp.]|nr:transcription antitermination factor NusB [Acholeplasma sp.]
TYELKYSDLDTRIIINEAVELTKKLSDLDDGKQHKFTNKLLDNIAKSLRG